VADTQSARYLHVASGHATTGTIETAGIPGTLSVWAEVLHEGPVPEGVSDDELRAIRARHVAGPGGVAEDVLSELREWERTLDTFPDYDELVLWYEHDLFDQLNLIQVLDRLSRAHQSSSTRISLISIGSFPGRPAFKGMGELTPAELGPLFETRQPVREDQYSLARRAWKAFRSPDPREIEALLSTDTSAWPFLGPALARHLQEFPSTVNGLSRCEQRLLDLVDAGYVDVRKAFPRMHDGETHFYIGDLSFWNLVSALARSSPPLLDIVESDTRESFPRATCAITAAGQDVRRGTADRIRLCGLDRWLGGVHLDGADRPWRWDPATGRLTRMP
jgi:hypothetical protein